VQSPLAGTVAAVGSDKLTMMGMPAKDLPGPAPQAYAIPPAMKTMLGVAMPGIAPTGLSRPSNAASEPSGTLLGVAIPGIAPIAPGAAGYGSQPRVPAVAPIVPAPAPLVVEPLPEAPLPRPRRGVPAVAVVAIVFGLVAIVGTAAAFIMLRAGAPLSAQPQLDETGKESLMIRCESCPDGTTIALGASSAKVQAASALLPLPAPLSIGDNTLEIAIDRPATGRDETVKIHVPVAYRVKADLTTLMSATPSITVRVEAAPGTEVTVDGKHIVLDESGKAAPTIDVKADVEGRSDDQKAIDRKIAFFIKQKGSGALESGELVVRAGVVPLHIDAPGVELFTDRPTSALAGQTKPGSTVTIDGQTVRVDPQGHFGVRGDLPSSGEKSFTIVASSPPLAPRIFRAKVVRVASVDEGAKTLEARTPLAFDAFREDPAGNVGKLVVVQGEVIEVRNALGHSVLLVEEKKTCPAAGSCIVRVLHGDEVSAARGDTVRVFGWLQGTVTASGKTVPDIEGALVVPVSKAKK
jgi:hypothetical protein